jgi:hypothetical protein
VVYEWASGTDFPASADRVGRRLEHLCRATGEIDPSAVVWDAQSPRSPLHPCFDWNDTSAARQERLRRAAEIVQAIRTVSDHSDTLEPTYVTVRRARRTVYIPFTVAGRAVSDLDGQVTQARSALATWVSQYRHLPATKKIVAAARDFLNRS